MKKNKSIENQITEVIVSDEIQQIPSDVAELALDSFLEDGILKDIPIVGWGISAIKLGANIRAQLFAKNLWTMLNEVKEIPVDQRKKIIDEIHNNEKHQAKVGESLITLIDKMDDAYKAKMIGTLFRVCIEEKISYEMFLRLSSIVIRTFSLDIFSLKELSEGKDIDQIQKENLMHQGLLSISIGNNSSEYSKLVNSELKDSLEFSLNTLSQNLLQYLFIE